MERPILFSGPMVKAILSGRKTMTRRVIDWKNLHKQAGLPFPTRCQLAYFTLIDGWGIDAGDDVMRAVSCPHGKPGDRLIVKEAAWMWCEKRPNSHTKTGRQKWLYVPLRSARVVYCADSPSAPDFAGSPSTDGSWAWRNKIGRFLPRWASRITLEIVNVRVERVQEISEEDALAEGIQEMVKSGITPAPTTPRAAFHQLWDSINAKRGFGWDANPHVWAIEFKRITP